MQQLELDNILNGSENALTDRQTDRQTAADAGRENSQGKESVKACGRYEQGTAYIKAIYTEALEEGIRCAMCTNTIKSDTGCDGGCIVDTKMYNKVMTEINSRLLRRPPKKGHWVKEESPFGWDGYSYQCSECGRSIHLDTEMEDLEDYPYCHCGAKMQDDMTELTIEDLEALEQEPCKDAVSVASVFEIMGNLMSIPYDFDRSITEKDVSESMDKIRALPRVTPQEPFKPMVEIDLYSVIKQKYIEREVLDKIRAEMFEEMLSHSGTGEEVIQAYASGLKKGLYIIDKYKVESEG